MRKFFGLILFLSQIFYSQNLIRTNIQDKKLEDFVKFEIEIGSRLYKSDKSHISFKPILEPVIFERTEEVIPDLLVFYTPYKDGSTIYEILYEWDVRNFNKSDVVKKSLSFNKAMINKYREIVDGISKNYGKSVHEGSIDDLSPLNSDGIKRSDRWTIDNGFTINSYIVLSEYRKKDGVVTTIPTHKIRLYVTNEKDAGN